MEEEDPADDSITVKIGVRDRNEPPSAPTVTVTSPAISGDVATLAVVWEAENTGPDISGYDVQYRKGSGSFSDNNCGTTGDNNCNITGSPSLTTTIVDLEEDTSYSVQVRATNEEGTSAWSRLFTLKTNKGTNEVPTFTDGATAEREIAHRELSRPVMSEILLMRTTTVPSSLTYSLGGRDASLFTIVASSGQMRARSSLNHEDPACGYDSTDNQTECTYEVRVKVDDKAGGSASIAVDINVTDVEGASCGTVRAEGYGDERHRLEPRRDLDCAAKYGQASHQRL